MRIARIDVAAYTIATDAPESDGTIAWDKTTIVVVEARAGDGCGMGYSYAHAAAAQLVADTLTAVVSGRSAFDIAGAYVAMTQAVRNIGRPGIASGAISAVDVALWDLKARLLGVPLVSLLGAARLGHARGIRLRIASDFHLDVADARRHPPAQLFAQPCDRVGREPAAAVDRDAVARGAE